MTNIYELLLNAKQEDQIAIEELVQRFEPKIKKISSTFPIDEKEDLEQELRMQIVKSIRKFNIEHQTNLWSHLGESNI